MVASDKDSVDKRGVTSDMVSIELRRKLSGTQYEVLNWSVCRELSTKYYVYT